MFKFKDGTLKKGAYVVIDNVEHEVHMPEYEGETPISAENLNLALQGLYPVGSIYMSVKSTNPAELFGFGTWEEWGKGKVPVGVDTSDNDFKTVEKTGGEKTHQLTANEMPVKGIIPYDSSTTEELWCIGEIKTYSAGGYKIKGTDVSVGSHNNLQPYITCYMWKRIA